MICSYQPLQDEIPLVVSNGSTKEGSSGNCEITKSGVKERESGKSTGKNHYNVLLMDDNHAGMAGMEVKYTGEKAEDGGYLIGIQYEVISDKAPSLKLTVSMDSDNTLPKMTAEMKLPETTDLPTVRFVSEENGTSEINLSPIACQLTLQEESGSRSKEIQKMENRMKEEFIMKDGKRISISDLADHAIYANEAVGTDHVESNSGKTDSGETKFFNKSETFHDILNIEEVDRIEVNGERFVKAD